MESQSKIPDEWEVEEVNVVTVDPISGEIDPDLSSSGAGPQYDEVRGRINKKPCRNCNEGEMVFEAPHACLMCLYCGNTESSRLHKNRHAMDL